MKPAGLIVSPAPHRHLGGSVTCRWYNIALALLPAVIAGIVRYGWGGLGVIGLAVASAMAGDALGQRLFGKAITLADGSAIVSGLLFGMLLPAGTPMHMVIVAGVLGTFVVKQIFGGLGANPLNPALVSWAILRITGAWSANLDFDLALVNYDLGFPLKYPLAVVKQLGAAGAAEFSKMDLFLGRQTGGVGSTAVVWLLIGGLYVLLRGIVPWRITLGFLLGVFFAGVIFHAASPERYPDAIFHLLAGNAVFGAFFLATDYGSSPVNRWPMFLFGLGAGMLTVVLRSWSTYPDGVVFACLLMSLFVPLLDRLRPKGRVAPAAVPRAPASA